MYKYLVELSVPEELSPNKDYLSLVNHYKGLPWNVSSWNRNLLGDFRSLILRPEELLTLENLVEEFSHLIFHKLELKKEEQLALL